ELERRAAERGIYIPLEGIKNSTNKIVRISQLDPMIASGYLILNRKHKHLIEELTYFPKAGSDDSADSLEMACRIAREPGKVTAKIL
ncbi:unnamed protein product, partial [marine sediment metagenome]